MQQNSAPFCQKCVVCFCTMTFLLSKYSELFIVSRVGYGSPAKKLQSSKSIVLDPLGSHLVGRKICGHSKRSYNWRTIDHSPNLTVILLASSLPHPPLFYHQDLTGFAGFIWNPLLCSKCFGYLLEGVGDPR